MHGRVAACERRRQTRRIPAWLKIAYSAFVAAIVPVYVRQYGWRNFLWFSDVALLATVPALGLADYMFDRKIPRPVRALSLFHLWLPPLLLWTVGRLGYDRRAFRAQTLSTW